MTQEFWWLVAWSLVILLGTFVVAWRGGTLTERDKWRAYMRVFKKTVCYECGGLLAPTPCKCERPPSWGVTNADSKALGEFTP